MVAPCGGSVYWQAAPEGGKGFAVRADGRLAPLDDALDGSDGWAGWQPACVVWCPVAKGQQLLVKVPPPELLIKVPPPELLIKVPPPELLIKVPPPEPLLIKVPPPELLIKVPPPEHLIKVPPPELLIKEAPQSAIDTDSSKLQPYLLGAWHEVWVDPNAWAIGPLPVSHFVVKAAARPVLLMGLRAEDPEFSVIHGHRPRLWLGQMAQAACWPWSGDGRTCLRARACRCGSGIGLAAAGWRVLPL